ncbi:hypothetical protein GCM10007939_23840 [Amylibacter marinus]|uniref:Uncharacterized protein n=1 Tax=Amylibacter marinus TaxID=1475483 RepID=A0ABQ5VXV7_9RHOB|nr:hypothetical protein [Amylibacter marinus]GLQ36100.1 hypothetical protein GCM10007939_23840 [Amylibacter marinus]
MTFANKIGDLVLLPGTVMCRYFKINPEDEMGLMRSFFNFLFWLPLGILAIYLYV